MTVAPTSIHPARGHRVSRWVLVAIAAFLLGGLAVALLYHYDVFGGSSDSSSGGSGVSATQVRDVAAFKSVELAGGNNVVIHVGGAQSVVVKADDNFLNRVTTEVHSGRLVIANTPGSLSTRSPMSVDVVVPTLSVLTLSGSGNIVVEGLDTESLTVALPGSGMLTGSGAVKRLDVTVSGSGVVQFTRLVANDAKAVVSGSGSILITATKSLDASVPGSGAIIYNGSPQSVTKSVTGTGVITGG